METTNLLNKEQKAKELGVSIRTLDRWIRQGKMQVIRVPRSKRRWFLPKVVDESN